MSTINEKESASPLSQLFGLPREATSFIHEAIEAIDPETGWPDIIKLLMAENPVDLLALDDVHLVDMHVHQARSNLACGPDGVAEEWFEYGRDRIASYNKTTVTQNIIVGTHDNMASIKQGIVDWSQHTGAKIHWIEKAGHLVFLTHTRELVEALELQ